MATQPDTQARNVFGRHCFPWADDEMRKLRELAPKTCGRNVLLETFPERTLKATKKQLSKVRHELGLSRAYGPCKTTAGPPILDPDDAGFDDGEERAWRRSCTKASEKFLAAMQRAGFVREHA